MKLINVQSSFTRVLILLSLFLLTSQGYGVLNVVAEASSQEANETSDETNEVFDYRDIEAYPQEFPGGKIEHIEGDYLNGFHLLPDHKESLGTLVFFGGSEGSPNFNQALYFAENGYETYALFFFGMENQQNELNEVPLDFFQELLDDYINKGGDLEEPLTVYGASKGAELALNLGVIYDEIDHLVLMAPSAYNFFALTMSQQDLSSWTFQEEPLPYLSYMDGKMSDYGDYFESMSQGEFHYLATYLSPIENAHPEKIEAARIKVEEFEGELLVFAGGDDQVWPSDIMAETIETHASNAEIHIFPEAGHAFIGEGEVEIPGFGTMITGGDLASNEAAGEEYVQRLLEKIEAWHSQDN